MKRRHTQARRGRRGHKMFRADARKREELRIDVLRAIASIIARGR